MWVFFQDGVKMAAQWDSMWQYYETTAFQQDERTLGTPVAILDLLFQFKFGPRIKLAEL